jgi:hypothetical protein
VGDAVEIVVDERDQAVEGGGVSLGAGGEKRGDLTGSLVVSFFVAHFRDRSVRNADKMRTTGNIEFADRRLRASSCRWPRFSR